MARFKSPTNMFFIQLRNVSHCRNYSQDIVHNIMRLLLYKPNCKLFNNDLNFKVYIPTDTQAISERKIRKLIFNITLKLPIKLWISFI